MTTAVETTRPRKAWLEPVVHLRSGRSVDLRNVDPQRLMSVAECEEVAAGLRQRFQMTNARLSVVGLSEIERRRASEAARMTAASRMAVLGRMRFLQTVGDQHVELMSDAARFVEVARRRLGREVFAEIMAEAQRGASVSIKLNRGGVALS